MTYLEGRDTRLVRGKDNWMLSVPTYELTDGTLFCRDSVTFKEAEEGGFMVPATSYYELLDAVYQLLGETGREEV